MGSVDVQGLSVGSGAAGGVAAQGVTAGGVAAGGVDGWGGPAGSRGRSRSALVDALDAEWEQLAGDGRAVVAGWSQRHPGLRAETLADVLAQVRHDPDVVLGLLLAESAAGDRTARRVVLQALLGKLVTMARKDAYAGVDDYVAVAWVRICDYPLAARPVQIAANLVLDTLKAVQAERRWLVRGEVTPWPPDAHLDEICSARRSEEHLDHAAAAAALTADRVIETAGRLGLVTAEVADALLDVYALGLSGTEVAERRRTSPALVRQRCSRGLRRLADHVDVLLEAA